MFECAANPSPLYGNQAPPCQWYHNDELIDESDEKYELTSDGNKHTIKVKEKTGNARSVFRGGGAGHASLFLLLDFGGTLRLRATVKCFNNKNYQAKEETMMGFRRQRCVVVRSLVYTTAMVPS